ncbi:MAG: type II toxin-antitoxin system RelE/ParE family toxin [Longimicrobiaceae bacterium]
MRRPEFTAAFKRDFRRMERRGRDAAKLHSVLDRLLRGEPHDPRHRDHKLKGKWTGSRECHIEPDWPLIYRIEGEVLYLERTGTHQDLFE